MSRQRRALQDRKKVLLMFEDVLFGLVNGTARPATCWERRWEQWKKGAWIHFITSTQWPIHFRESSRCLVIYRPSGQSHQGSAKLLGNTQPVTVLWHVICWSISHPLPIHFSLLSLLYLSFPPSPLLQSSQSGVTGLTSLPFFHMFFHSLTFRERGRV